MMTTLLKKGLKALLIITLVLLLGLVVFGLVLTLGWPLWMGAFILAAIVGLVLIVWFIRRILVRRREKQFVDQVIAQDEASLQKVDVGEAQRLRDLQSRWKEAVEALKSSHLKQYGNPLYVLPWYLVIGESGSGKTTAIKNAGLSSPFAEVSRTSGLSGTRNCDWWFFEQAVLLDTAGRYALPVDEGRDRDEWHQFLGLLAKFRKKEPLNGLVVTIAADKLAQSNTTQLEETGRSIRKRMDELMRILGTKFPIYILVTKCDLIQGMASFCDRLDEETLKQAMGAINRKTGERVTSFISQTIATIAERLRDLRLVLLHQSSTTNKGPIVGDSADPDLILFPDEFEHLKPGLTAFMQSAFQPNPYQETPILRGLYFSSGRQEGTPYSHFLKALGVIESSDVLPGTDRGFFLHNLFTNILPHDRRLFVPTTRSLRWGRLTRNIGLTAWVTILIALCGILSFSFVKNLQIIRSIPTEFAQSPVMENKLLSDLTRMERFREVVLTVEKKNRNWWFPRFGLNQSIEVENRLKKSFTETFSRSLSAAYDQRLEESLADFDRNTPDAIVGRAIAHLTRRINLLNARMDGEPFDALQTNPLPVYDTRLAQVDPSLSTSISTSFNLLSNQYLVWQNPIGQLNDDIKRLQNWLKYILSVKPDNMNWLVTWANQQPNLNGFILEEFWGDRLRNPDHITIPPAFTLDGKKAIYEMIAALENALTDASAITDKKPIFNQWYHQAYAKIWREFTATFPKGEYWLADKTAWQQVAQKITTDESPYFIFLDTLAIQLQALDREEETIPWLHLVKSYQIAKNQTVGEKTADKLGVLAKATKKGKSLLQKMDKMEQKINTFDQNLPLESRLTAAKSYHAYRQALTDIALAAESRQVSYQLTVAYFKEDPATSESPFFIAHKELKKLQNAFETGHPEYQKEFWDLASGPLFFMRDYVNLETACHLNTLWEKDVLFEIQGIRDKTRVQELLFGTQGYGLKFINGPAAPFLSRSLDKGFFARYSLGRHLPFEPTFLDFITDSIELAKQKKSVDLNAGIEASLDNVEDPNTMLELLFLRDYEKPPLEPIEIPPPAPASPTPVLKDKYIVSIKGLPTDVNSGAKVKPHATRLTLICKDQKTQLINLNFPVKKTFTWIPKNCEKIILKIEIGGHILTRTYSGTLFFPDFFKDFKSGRRTFALSEFSEDTAALKKLGVKYIKVNYEFDGHEPVAAIMSEKEKEEEKQKEAMRIAMAAQNASQARDARKKAEFARKQMNIKDILSQWEAKQALKEFKKEQAQKRRERQKKLLAQKVKQAWEARIPEVPRNIVTCWDH